MESVRKLTIIIYSKIFLFFFISQNIFFIFVFKIPAMKKLKIYLFITLLSLSVSTLCAQRGRVKPKKKVAAVEESPEQKLYKTMLPTTAKVMFIDSVVVGKEEFISKLPINHAAGKLSVTYPNSKKIMLGQYENDFADRRLYAKGDTAGTALYSQVLLGNGWGKQNALSEISEKEFPFQNFPFLCTDGVTLFFAAKGQNSIGGYDIFMTSFDSDKGAWYAPQNYGLPYNSTANDYLLAINDLDSLGWLVTDRYQNEDSVCIYTFVPTYPRLDFTSEDLTQSQLESFAKISDISQTWRFGDRQKALRRRDAMIARTTGIQVGENMCFVINDDRIVSSVSDFKSEKSRMLYKQLQELRSMMQSTRKVLEDKRESYANGNKGAKADLTDDILRLENELSHQNADIKLLEKKIRRLELTP